ncbi:hypothetical protein NHQ30_011379 [Ciborinia camelliae]|nr:hypothetical protein NHQ30_011379 [Ciborinia camelliae]
MQEQASSSSNQGPREYSTVPKTRNERIRKSKMNSQQLESEKERDRRKHAVSYALKKLRNSDDYKNASEDDRKSMENKTRNSTLTLRAQKVLKSLDLVQYNGSPCSESESEEEDSSDFEEWDNISESDMEEDMDSSDEEVAAVEQRDIELMNVLIEYNQSVMINSGIPAWLKSWSTVVFRFLDIMKALEVPEEMESSKIEWVKDTVDGKEVYLYPVLPPHKVFNRRQRAVWRNLASWGSDEVKNGMDDKVTLPGPQKWWDSLRLKGYNPKRHGFWIPHDGSKYRRAWDIVMCEKWKKEDVSRVLMEFDDSDILKDDRKCPDDYFML